MAQVDARQLSETRHIDYEAAQRLGAQLAASRGEPPCGEPEHTTTTLSSSELRRRHPGPGRDAAYGSAGA